MRNHRQVRTIPITKVPPASRKREREQERERSTEVELRPITDSQCPKCPSKEERGVRCQARR